MNKRGILLMGFAAIVSGCNPTGQDEVAAGAIAAEASGSQTQEQPAAQPQDAQAVLAAWFECEECREGQLRAVVALGQEVVPRLATYLAEGPPEEALASRRAALQGSYQRLTERLGAERMAEQQMTQSDYLELYAGNYVSLYRVRSAMALGEIGGPAARQALAAVDTTQVRAEVAQAVREARAKIRARG